MQVQSPAVDGEKIIRRATLKLMPFLGLLYLIAYLDRQNIGFAKLQMVADLGVSEAAYLLGACEAGFYPGVLYYLTLWFPVRHRARLIGYFMIGSALANAVAAPIGGALLDFDGLLGMRGWQWVFIVTGMAAVLMSPV